MNQKIKIFIPFRNCLNENLLKNEFELVNESKLADIVIAQSTFDASWDMSKTIYIAVEPPLADHRLWCYSNFDNFKLVITHNPDKSKKNQIPFTDSNEPQYFPVYANPSIVPQYTRTDTRMTYRGVFYAGMIGPYENVPNSFNGINLTKVRRQLGQYLSIKFPSSKIIGIGWNYQTVKVPDWRVDKSNQILQSKCDFVLALENTMLPNYLYEKIWDGFASDRVTLYLGDPNIDEHIPLNCFIDLRPYFNKENGKFDFDALGKKLETLSQEEYDVILKNARLFRETAIGKHTELQNKLTNKLIEFIKINHNI